MNELQIRLTADIKDLQSALNKAKATIKSFESETAKDKKKSNAEEERTIGLIERQIQKAKELKISLSQATNEKDVAFFNAELEKTNQELTRLNSLGKSFGGTAVQSFNNLKRSAGAAAGTAISFSRIIQDAPFGIIGVANNIQNFGEQFVALGDKSTTAAGKLKLFFSALITPSNLAILAVSALTAAYQAYTLGLFGAKDATDQVKDSIDSYRKSLKESESSQLEAIKNSDDEIIKLTALKGIIEDETLERSKRLKAIEKANEISPDIFKNLTTEAVLAGKVGDAYEKVTRLLIAKATAESDIQKVVSLNDEERILRTNEKNIEVLNKIAEIEERVNRFRKEGQEEVAIANENSIRYLKNQNPEVARLLEIESQRDILTKSISDNLKIALDETTKTKEQADELKRILEDINALPRIGLPRSGDREALLKQRERLQQGGQVGATGQEFIQSSLQQVIDKGIITSLPTTEVSDNFKELSDEIKFTIDDLSQAFTGLGSVIGRAFNNPQLGTFLGTFLTFASKLVAANFKIAGSNAVAGASQASLATGPAAPLTLPGFIAGALGVVAAAFAAFGNFGSSSSSSMSAGQGSTFTNRREFGGPVSKGRAYIVGERRPELFVPNTNGVIIPQVPSMDYSGTSMSAGAMAIDVNIQGVSYGDDILFTVQQAQIRRGIR
jgi:hypothetical protein